MFNTLSCEDFLKGKDRSLRITYVIVEEVER